MSLKCLILANNNLDPARLVILADALVSRLEFVRITKTRKHLSLFDILTHSR